MKRKIILKVLILSFLFSASVVANPTIDVRISNRIFKGNATSGTFSFDVEIKAGPGYRSSGVADGEWIGMNLRIDIYGEPGITYNVPKDAVETTHDFPETHRIQNLTYGDYPGALGTVPGVVNTVSIQAGRNSMGSTFDLSNNFIRIATISIPVKGGIPTSETRLLVRTTDNYLPIRSAFWANTADFTLRRPIRMTSEVTDTQTVVIEDDKIWAVKDELFIQSNNIGSTVRIYSMDGALHKEQKIVFAGVTTIKLSRGVYAVSINSNQMDTNNIVRIN